MRFSGEESAVETVAKAEQPHGWDGYSVEFGEGSYVYTSIASTAAEYYKRPAVPEILMKALGEASDGTFAGRIRSLMQQLGEQGADVSLWSTVRDRRRGYLMWGAFLLSRKTEKKQVLHTVRFLQRLNRKWGMNVPIRWLHPSGWKATVRAARRMSSR